MIQPCICRCRLRQNCRLALRAALVTTLAHTLQQQSLQFFLFRIVRAFSGTRFVSLAFFLTLAIVRMHLRHSESLHGRDTLAIETALQEPSSPSPSKMERGRGVRPATARYKQWISCTFL